jgi:Xaa-Pro aminopeptidase
MFKVKNLIDDIRRSDIKSDPSRDFKIKPHNSTYSGVHWKKKVEQLKEHLRAHRCDAMVVTSLTEIAYLLNLRGKDFKYIPVFRAYLVVSQEIYLYTNTSRVSEATELMMNYYIRDKACLKQPCVMYVKFSIIIYFLYFANI